jgi:zinc protease
MRRAILPILTIALAAGCIGPLPRLSPEPVPGRISDPAVHRGVLDNGLTFIIRSNPEPANRAELRLVVNAGSILEDDDQRGLAHVVEHMAFNGTRNFERQAIVDYLEGIGMRFGPDLNAYTSFDETVYLLTVPTDTAGALRTGVQILEEWAWGIVFDSLRVEKERGVVMEEWRLGQGASSRVQEQQFPKLAYGSRYAERLPIGTPESLRTFSHAALRRFYEMWYRPDLMAVVAVGDFDVTEMERLIREHFDRIPAREEAIERRMYAVPRHRETLIAVATDPELTTGSVALHLKRRPRAWRGRADYRAWLTETLAGSMLINRLNEQAQQVDAPFLDVSSFQGRFVRTLSTFGITARARGEGIEAAAEALLREVERASRHGFTASELEREKRELMRVMEQRFAERERTTSASYAADYVSHFLYGGNVLDHDEEWDLYRELIPEVSLRETNRLARDWSGSGNRVLLVSVPERDGVEPPDEAALRAVIGRVPRMAITRYDDEHSQAPLVAEVPEPGTIVSEQELREIGAYRWTLENGATVVLKPTDFREEEVLFAARSPGGTSLFDEEDHVAALTASAVVQAGGLGELSAVDLRKRLAGSVAGVGAEIGEMHEGLSGAASPRDLETLFQLVHLKFTSPRKDSTAFLAYQGQARSAMENRSANPDIAFLDTLRVTLTQGHPRARPPSARMFDDLDLHRSFEIYRDRFADASDFTFYLVGNFDPEVVRPLVRTYLASLPGLGRVEQGRDLGIRPPRGIVEKTVRRGLEPRASTQIVFTGPMEFERSNVLTIQWLADLLRLRLRESLREDLGGTYGVGVRGSASRDPVPQYQFAISFGSDPERVEELVGVVFAEIDALQREGPLPGDMAKVREMQFRAREIDLRQNQFWLGQILAYEQYGWDLEQIPATASRLTVIERDAIQDAARRFLDPANYVRVTLLPEWPGRPAADP